jgi:hypothetical protein
MNERLVWFPKTNWTMTECQSGFHKQHRTADPLVRLESFQRGAVARCKHVVVVFFIWIHYDITRNYGALPELHGAGLRGRLPVYHAFLLHQQIRVQVISHLSDPFPQEMGKPEAKHFHHRTFHFENGQYCAMPSACCTIFALLPIKDNQEREY